MSASGKKKDETTNSNLEEFTRKNPDCKFSASRRPTVRQQMEYFSATAGASGSQLITRYWLGARMLIKDWECEAVPSVDVDLDEISNPEQTEILIWAAMKVKTLMDTLENIPKNS